MSPNLWADHSLSDGKRQGVEVNASKRVFALTVVYNSGRRHLLTGIF
jgi:hypothetical protein